MLVGTRDALVVGTAEAVGMGDADGTLVSTVNGAAVASPQPGIVCIIIRSNIFILEDMVVQPPGSDLLAF